MSYRGRELTAGNYLKLDDLQSQFNSSTTTFNLTSGGTAFYPGSAFSIQVVLGGVIQEPESAYTINQSQITFASAPGSGDDFFCIALGVSLGIGVPGEGTVTGTKLSKPFSYDDGLLVLDSTNNFIGVNSTTPTVALDIVGNVKVSGTITAALTGTATSTTNIPNLTGAITSNNTTTSLGSFSSANLSAALTDETGSGANVFATSPVLVTPSLGIATAQSLVVSGITTVSAGTTALPSITPSGDSNTGVFFPSADTIAASTGGTSRITIDSSGNITVTNNLIIPLGTSLLPSLAFLSDPNTGIYSPGADQRAVATNGTGRLFVDASGNVGVNTASPSTYGKFAVVDTQDGFLSSTFVNTSNGVSAVNRIQIGNDGSNGAGQLVVYGSQHSTLANIFDVNNANPAALRLLTNNTERARIRSDGTFEIKGAGTAGSSPGFSVNPSTPANSFVIDSSGQLGIGASSPIFLTDILSGTPNTGANVNNPSQLSVTGPNKTLIGGGATFFVNSNSDFAIDTGGSIALCGRNTTSSTNSVVWGVVKGAKENATSTNTAGYLAFASQNHNTGALVEAMRIDSQQRLGIGTSSPGESLHTTGKLRVGDGGNYTVAAVQLGTSNANGISFPGVNILNFITNSTAALTIDASQRVGIGITNPSQILHIVGATAGTVKIDGLTRGGCNSFNLNGTQTSVIGNTGTILGDSTAGLGLLAETGNEIRLYTNGTVTPRVIVDTSGRLLIGTSTSIAVLGVDSAIQVVGTGVDAFSSILRFSATAADCGGLLIGRSKSATKGTNTAVIQNDALGEINFAGATGTTYHGAASISAFVDGEVGTSGDTTDMPGRLVFSTTADGASSPTERMRIKSDGNILIGKTTAGIGNAGIELDATAQDAMFTTYQATSVFVNRTSNDGVLIDLQQDSVSEGTISVSGTTVSYNGAHLSRWSQLPSGAERIEILRGSVLSNLDEMCEWGKEENEQLNRMKVSTVEGDKNVSGVFQSWDDDDDTYTNDFYCAMTGDFIIRIAEGATVERGDLLMSAGDGTAKPQDDDIIRSKTVAKVTSTNVSCTYEDGSYCVPCVLMAC